MARPVPDELGKMIAENVVRANEFPTLVDYFRHQQGRGNFTNLRNIQHPAQRLLRHISSRGAPVLIQTPPWSATCTAAAVRRGPHKSAYEFQDFLRNEMTDMIHQAFWTVLPYSRIKHLKSLRVSPVGVVPQHERRPRTIVDYSFSNINVETLKLSPQEAMQFGRALERIITQVVHADPRYGPVKFIKLDLSDGFYQISVRADDIPKLGVVFPSLTGEEPLIAFPLSLPMGWTESPPYFCAFTETIADIANQRILKWRRPPRHHLERIADTQPTSPASTPAHEQGSHHQTPALHHPCQRNPLLPTRSRILNAVDVFVDDFIAIAQGSPRRLNRIRRILLEAIDDVLRPSDALDPPHRKQPISVTKLRQGDACWGTIKKVLGWIIDSVAMTITLPPRRLQRLAELLASIPRTQARLSLQKWYKILGELRSMSLALPGTRGLFSALQAALKSSDGKRLRLTQSFHEALSDFDWIRTELASRPTRLQELVPTAPSLYGTHDASGLGAGGVWFPGPTAVPRRSRVVSMTATGTKRRHRLNLRQPILWRYVFPPNIRTRLVTYDNPNGTISNSDLELAGSLFHQEAAVQCFDVRERTIKDATDNIATMYWTRKGSTTSIGPPAKLLRLASIHQRYHRYLNLKDYLEGRRNTMADNASCLVTLTTSKLLTYFDSTYPQALPWALWTLTQQFSSAVTMALHKRTSPLALYVRELPPPLRTGNAGPISVPLSESILPLKSSKIPSPSYKSSCTGIAPAPSRTVEDALQAVGQAFSSVGSQDPRLNTFGKIDFRLQRQLSCYAKQDPPPNHVKPIPVPILQRIMAVAIQTPTMFNLAIADIIAIAFFFFLRPGKYTSHGHESMPFRLADVQLFQGPARLDLAMASDTALLSATFASLTFTTQKNGVQGEVIGLSHSGNPQFSPTLCIACRILHLRQHNALPQTPLASVYNAQQNAFEPIKAANITVALKLACLAMGPAFGFNPSNISARSLRASGAMALLCAQVDSSVIRLLGRWRSDEMLRYLTSRRHLLCVIFIPKCSPMVLSPYIPTKMSPCSSIPACSTACLSLPSLMAPTQSYPLENG